MKELASLVVQLGLPACTGLTPDLVQKLHGENAWSIQSLCGVMLLRQQIADEQLPTFLQGHPASIQPLLSTTADKTLAWQWILKYATLADMYPQETYAMLLIKHPVYE